MGLVSMKSDLTWIGVRGEAPGQLSQTSIQNKITSYQEDSIQAQYNKFSTLQTDSSGRLKISNMMGYGRTADQVADGISCIAGKFYSSGYQELGLSGITSNTHTGLAASTTYHFTVAVDGGSP